LASAWKSSERTSLGGAWTAGRNLNKATSNTPRRSDAPFANRTKLSAAGLVRHREIDHAIHQPIVKTQSWHVLFRTPAKSRPTFSSACGCVIPEPIEGVLPPRSKADKHNNQPAKFFGVAFCRRPTHVGRGTCAVCSWTRSSVQQLTVFVQCVLESDTSHRHL
jgi:hypothetical protein